MKEFIGYKSNRLKGEPVQNYEMFARAWEECVELQCTPKDEWTGRAILSMQEIDRVEIGVFCDGKIVGGIVVGLDAYDVHVGPCASVFAQYVLPEYRNRGASRMMMKEAVLAAKSLGVQCLAFTHRKGPWRYETIYRRLRIEKS